MADADRQAVAVVAQVIHLLTCRATALKAACDGPTSLDFETARSVIASVRPHLLAAEVSAHRAEQDATIARVRSLLDAAILISGERYLRADYVREALEADRD